MKTDKLLLRLDLFLDDRRELTVMLKHVMCSRNEHLIQRVSSQSDTGIKCFDSVKESCLS